MKKQILIICTLTFLFGITHIISNAQATINSPYSFSNDSRSIDDIPILSFESFNLEQALLEDEDWRAKGHESFIFAKPIKVEIDIKEDGLLEVLSGNTNIWRLALESKGAFSLSVKFDICHFAPNTNLFIYNRDKSQILELSADGNHYNEGLITEEIKGDYIILEIQEPAVNNHESAFKISQINHGYRNFYEISVDCPDWGYGQSIRTCHKDINCSEGDDWQVEKDAVLLMVIDGCTVCTGTLVNNTDLDGTPYVLTADHCYTDYESRFGVSYSTAVSNTTFYFNYESPTCWEPPNTGGGDGSKNQSLSGASLIANWSDLDFCLLKIDDTPLSSFNPYYAGWYNLDVAATSASTIHHPVGDVKKISINNPDSSAVSTDFGVRDEVSWGDHWAVYWDNSMTEGGSSGAALFNQNHRVVGQLHGGNSNCQYINEDEGPHQPSYFGKLYYSWDGNNSNTSRLRDWLNPEDDTNELAGLRLIDDFTITSNTSTSGDIVLLNDVAVQSGTDVVIEFTDSFKATGTFSIPSGCTLEINP